LGGRLDISTFLDILLAVTSLPLTDTRRTATLFHALSDPTRIEILNCLASCERCVCDLTGALDAAQSRLSFHLKVLREAGLITDRRSGRWVYYSLVPDALADAQEYVESLRQGATSAAGGCCG
jgi:ArsR family transcriptional regulator, arsenate/arsenite/antimonite-responsive transcriptional repressor